MLLLKIIRKFFKIVNGANAVWQVAVGVFIGTLLGFMPVWPALWQPSPLALGLVAVALVLNCHFGSVLLFAGLGSLLAWSLQGVAAALGESLDGLARSCAELPLLHLGWLSHTGYLGATVLGLVVAPIFALVMALVTRHFQNRVRPALERRRAMVTGASVATHGIVVRLACWFLDI